MNVMFTLDRNYLDILKTCIRSFTRFRAPDGYDVYILHSDFTDADKRGRRRRRAAPLYIRRAVAVR